MNKFLVFLIIVLIISLAVIFIKYFRKPEVKFVTRFEKVEIPVEIEDMNTQDLVTELIKRKDIAVSYTEDGKGAKLITFSEEMLITGNTVILIWKGVD